ncbi:unnamed protein product [Clonostachys rosea]|uniref:Ubiquitin-like domain-containing protein n=1 Tax=Bionectria ochroleuca TaxID=29856 RepID=A0ABY6TYI8_BIOOC|nr:unnamed protein product [Clonostachys rosea]
MLTGPGHRRIRVKFDGRSFDIEIQDTATVRALKESIETETSIPVQRQVLSVLGPGAVSFDDAMLIKDAVKPQSTIMVQDTHVGNNQRFRGHQYGGTYAVGNVVHQGDAFDHGFWGQPPRNRGYHDYSDVFCNNGLLRRGDHYVYLAETPRMLQQSEQHQGERYRESLSGGAQDLLRRGHTYGIARTEDTDHTQGDEIYSGWSGPAPAGASHQYGEIRSIGGGLHQGNKYGQPV